MLIVWLLPLLLNTTMAVPTGNAIELLAGITTPPVVIEMCLPASASASV
jgi:hypothetical protein